MSPKIKMKDIHDDHDDDIIELSDEELKEILGDDDFDAGVDDEIASIPEYYFANLDPYFKVKSCPDNVSKRDISFDDKGNIVVKNPSIFCKGHLCGST